MTERTTVRLEPGLLRAAKKKAAEEGRTLTSLIEEGLRRLLSGTRAGKPGPRYPRISKQSGGVRPGIDLTRTSELLEMLDDELPLEKRR